MRFFDPERAQFGVIPPGDRAGPADGVGAPVQKTWSVSTPTWHHFYQVHLWSPEEWRRLPTKPTDVQVCPDGSRVALRVL